MVRKLAVLALVSISASANAAQPLAKCVADDVAKIKAMILQDSTTAVFGTPVAPAVAYEGMNQTQVASMNSNTQGVHAHVNEVEGRMRVAVNEFIATNGSPEATATVALGHADRRQVFQVLRRPKGQPNVTANTDTKCKADTCEDMAVKTQMLYVLKSSTVSKAVEQLAIYKAETTGNVDVFFCEASASCRHHSQLAKAGGVVQKTKTPAPLKIGVPYVMRESGMGVETTSVYKIRSTSICGKPATLMTGIGLKGDSAFDSATTAALAVESDDRVMVIAHFQGYVAGGRGKIPKWLLNGGIAGSIATSSFKGIYNRQAERLGADERIDGKGLLK